jgi:hypothetical protein
LHGNYVSHTDLSDDHAPSCEIPEFWERYVRWLENKGMEAEARGALRREVEVFCKTRPEAHLFGARFEERHGRVQVCLGE